MDASSLLFSLMGLVGILATTVQFAIWARTRKQLLVLARALECARSRADTLTTATHDALKLFEQKVDEIAARARATEESLIANGKGLMEAGHELATKISSDIKRLADRVEDAERAMQSIETEAKLAHQLAGCLEQARLAMRSDLDGMGARIEADAETLKRLNKQISDIDDRVRGAEENANKAVYEFDRVAGMVNGLREALDRARDSIEGDYGSLYDRVNAITGDISDIEADIRRILSIVQDQDSAGGLSQRIGALEEQRDAIKSFVETSGNLHRDTLGRISDIAVQLGNAIDKIYERVKRLEAAQKVPEPAKGKAASGTRVNRHIKHKAKPHHAPHLEGAR